MTLQTENITKDIILVTSADKPISEYFIRFQEHFESPVFRNKVFTLGQFKSWYAKEYGAFTYHTDWSGFNIPSHVLNPFIKGLFDPLTPEEQKLLELFKYRTGRFYIIGVNEKRSLDHEICHGLWYTNETYRNKVKAVLETYRTTSKFNEFYTALQADYNESVIEDEIHAYHAANDTESRFEQYVDLNLRQELREIRKEMGLLFEEKTEGNSIEEAKDKPKPFKIEVGKRYKTRDGTVTGDLLTFTEDGRWKFNGGGEDPLDLIEEVKEEPKLLKLEVGKRYKTRGGGVTEPLELSDDSSAKKGHPFSANIDNHFWTLTENGRCWDSELELIEEIKEEPVKIFEIEAGKSYKTRNGKITGPLEYYGEQKKSLMGLVGETWRIFQKNGEYLSRDRPELDLIEEVK